jgi:hypothetical protein
MLPVPVRCLIQFRVALLRDRSSPVRVFLPGKPARENPRPILGPILPFYSATIRRLKCGQFRLYSRKKYPRKLRNLGCASPKFHPGGKRPDLSRPYVLSFRACD